MNERLAGKKGMLVMVRVVVMVVVVSVVVIVVVVAVVRAATGQTTRVWITGTAGERILQRMLRSNR